MILELDLSNNKNPLSLAERANSIKQVKVKNQLDYIPEWLINCRNIDSISFTDKKGTDQVILNPFSWEPNFVTCRTELLDYLPEELCLLKNIESLNVGLLKRFDSIKKLPEKIGKLENLEFLLLGKNKISQLPESLIDCKKITELSILHNPLKVFPKVIYELHFLERLDIGSENFMSLMVDLNKLSKLNNLGSLNLVNCSITSFPMELKNLQKLYALGLRNNLIRKLPNPILVKESFPQLNMIDLNENPVFEEDFEICLKWKRELFEYEINVNFE